MTLAGWTVAALLGVFTLRRLGFWLASLLPRRAATPARDRSIAVLVAARDEARHLPRLLAALDRLDYPAERLGFVVVSDGSADATARIAEKWCARRANARAVVLPVSRGKAGALRAARASAPRADLVAVIDADAVPAPDALARLAGAFANAAVGAACGYPSPGRDHRTVTARYAALERWVFHLVTLAGKDRLGLQPPVIGVLFCVRADALADAGGFPETAPAEDIELSLRLSRAGWKTRWIGEAVAREDVPDTIAAFRAQRLRWSRGLMASGRRARGGEELLAAAGYLDRLAFVAGLALAAFGALPAWIVAAYVAAPLVVIATALGRGGARSPLRYLWSVAPMALADIAVTAEALLAQLRAAPPRWKRR